MVLTKSFTTYLTTVIIIIVADLNSQFDNRLERYPVIWNSLKATTATTTINGIKFIHPL